MKKTVPETIPTTAETTTVACPQCSATVAWTSTSHWKPFCSERCKLLDLGAWADETYRVAGAETANASEIESALAASLSGVRRPH